VLLIFISISAYTPIIASVNWGKINIFGLSNIKKNIYFFKHASKPGENLKGCVTNAPPISSYNIKGMGRNSDVDAPPPGRNSILAISPTERNSATAVSFNIRVNLPKIKVKS